MTTGRVASYRVDLDVEPEVAPGHCLVILRTAPGVAAAVVTAERGEQIRQLLEVYAREVAEAERVPEAVAGGDIPG